MRNLHRIVAFLQIMMRPHPEEWIEVWKKGEMRVMQRKSDNLIMTYWGETAMMAFDSGEIEEIVKAIEARKS